jgi:hypothetical protein
VFSGSDEANFYALDARTGRPTGDPFDIAEHCFPPGEAPAFPKENRATTRSSVFTTTFPQQCRCVLAFNVHLSASGHVKLEIDKDLRSAIHTDGSTARVDLTVPSYLQPALALMTEAPSSRLGDDARRFCTYASPQMLAIPLLSPPPERQADALPAEYRQPPMRRARWLVRHRVTAFRTNRQGSGDSR